MAAELARALPADHHRHDSQPSVLAAEVSSRLHTLVTRAAVFILDDFNVPTTGPDSAAYAIMTAC